jgi:hypothetical protein
VSYRVLHCCNVEPGSLKAPSPPDSDRTTDGSADPGCANSGRDSWTTEKLMWLLGRHEHVQGVNELARSSAASPMPIFSPSGE